jgi:hypothetical protein
MCGPLCYCSAAQPLCVPPRKTCSFCEGSVGELHGAEDSCRVAFDRTSRRQKWLRFLVTMPSRRRSVVLWLRKPRPRVQVARSANDRQGHDHSRRGEGLQNVAIEPKQIRLPLTQKVNPLSNCDGDEYAMSDQG